MKCRSLKISQSVPSIASPWWSPQQTNASMKRVPVPPVLSPMTQMIHTHIKATAYLYGILIVEIQVSLEQKKKEAW